MAGVTFSHIGYITAIEPGDTHHVSWNNAAAQRVWAFSVDAMLSLTIPPAIGASARVEILRVEYREVHNGSGHLERRSTGGSRTRGLPTPVTPSTWPRSRNEEKRDELLVLCDSAGNIKSVAVPNQELPGNLQLGSRADRRPVSSRLTKARSGGRTCSAEKGARAQGRALQRLRELM